MRRKWRWREEDGVWKMEERRSLATMPHSFSTQPTRRV